MSKILITGNGFDLFHHLPTKYGHFMAIMETIEDCEIPGEVTFEDLFAVKFKKKFNDDYKLIKGNYKTSNIIFDKKAINDIRVNIKLNSWYKHFKSIIEIDTWIDFENEIENVLKQISIIIKHTEDKTSGNNEFFKGRPLNLNIDFSVFNFCSAAGDDFFIDSSYINSRTNKFDGNKILIELENSLNQFINIFNSYLSNIVVEFYDNYIAEFRIPIKYIDFYYTFNYTPTIERIYNKNIFITYLHGETNKDNMLQNLVLGVDEIPKEIISHKAFGFSKYYQKIINKTNNFLFQIPDKNTEITEENIFYIFGHSLDRSDKEHIGRVFDFLEKDYTRQSNIVVFYFSSMDNKNKLKNLFSFIKKEIIVQLNAEGRLSFVEINESNLKRELSKELWRKYSEDYTV